MPKFSNTSKERLESCHKDLQDIMNTLIKIMDVTILEGYRGEKKQNLAFSAGNSQLKFPHSKHNKEPSQAVDVVPYPIDWNNINEFERMCGMIEAIAYVKKIKIRLGRDFSFKDYPHIELLEE